MVHALSTWLLVAGFFGAGLINAIGTSATRSDFARWRLGRSSLRLRVCPFYVTTILRTLCH
jgi:hypothetical protein